MILWFCAPKLHRCASVLYVDGKECFSFLLVLIFRLAEAIRTHNTFMLLFLFFPWNQHKQFRMHPRKLPEPSPPISPSFAFFGTRSLLLLCYSFMSGVNSAFIFCNVIYRRSNSSWLWQSRQNGTPILWKFFPHPIFKAKLKILCPAVWQPQLLSALQFVDHLKSYRGFQYQWFQE